MSKERMNFYLVIFFGAILGIVADYFFYKKGIGISFFIFNLLITIFSLVLAKRTNKKLTKTQIFSIISALALSGAMFFRSNGFLSFFNFFGSGYLLILYLSLFSDKNILNFSIIKYIFKPIIFLFSSFTSTSGFIKNNKLPAKEKKALVSEELRGVLRGIIISFPILAVLFSLLYHADIVFQSYADRFIDLKINFDFELFIRLCIVFVLSYVFIGIFSKIENGSKKEEIAGNSKAQRKSLSFIESATILSLVEALFLLFIAIQFFYLFGGRNYVWGIDKYITYSEYARSGFNELILTAIISFLLIFGLDNFGRKDTEKENKAFKALSGVLTLETLIILASSFSRLALYIDGYGYTFLRFMAFAVLFWIAGVFIIFLYKIITGKKEGLFLVVTFGFSVIIWILINILNPDAFIARKNLERIGTLKKFDAAYFYSLSDDAISETVKIFSANIDEEAKENLALSLYYRYQRSDLLFCDSTYPEKLCAQPSFKDLLEKEYKSTAWQSFNASRTRAFEVLRANYSVINKYLAEHWKKEAKQCQDEYDLCVKNCQNDYRNNFTNCEMSCKTYPCENIGKITEINNQDGAD